MFRLTYALALVACVLVGVLAASVYTATRAPSGLALLAFAPSKWLRRTPTTS